MAAHRDLPFPLVIICLIFIRGYTPLPTTSEVTGTNPTTPLRTRGSAPDARALPPSKSYDDYDTSDVPETVFPDEGTHQRCDYNPCRENHSCADLAASSGCLCPGFTLHHVIPEAPNLKTVSWNGSEVVVHWCAPNSHISGYIVTVGGQKEREFNKTQRRGAVGNIDHTAEICVVAVNDGGKSEGSCMMYHPRDHSLPLKAGLIGGALGFLLLLLLAVLLWRHRRQRKQEGSMSIQYSAETQ